MLLEVRNGPPEVRPSTLLAKWVAPPLGTNKVNVDASWKARFPMIEIGIFFSSILEIVFST